MIVTGHDTDVHCGYGSPADDTGGHCHYIKVAVEYARAAAPDPTRKVLIVDCSGTFEPALGYAFNGAPPASDVVCPTDSAWPMTSLDTSTYSAMLVATSWNLTAEGSQALNSRKTDIEAFFNQGGGIFANTSYFVDTYYDFLPLAVGSGSNTSPYSLTPAGQQIGLQDSTQGIGTYNDINCCATHNSFEEPAIGGPIVVAERDANEKPITLIAEGTISGGAIVAPGNAPETALDTAPPALTNVDSANFTFSSVTAGATFECRLDEGEWSTCESPYGATQLAEGPHEFRVRAVKDGVADATPATHSWTVDTVAPGIPAITSGPGQLSTSPSATIGWTGEQGGHYMCEIDGDVPVACTSPLQLAGLSDGEHTVKIRQTDAAGNEGEPATHSWRVDTIAPSTVDDVPTSVQAGPATVTLTPTDGGSGVDKTYYTTGISPAAPTSDSPAYDPDHKPVLGDGESIRYFSVDLAGNAEAEHTAGPVRIGADLAVDVVAPATSWAGRRLTATTQVSNLGPADVTDAVVVLSVPYGEVVSQVSQTEGPAFECDAPVAETVSCTGPLAMGEAATFTVTARAPETGTMTHPATVSSSLFDPVADNDSDSASTEIQTSAGGGGAIVTPTPTPTPSPGASPVATPTPAPVDDKQACRTFTVGLYGSRYRGARIRTATLRAAGSWLRSLHPDNRRVRVARTGARSHAALTVRLQVELRSGEIVRVTRRLAACTA